MDKFYNDKGLFRFSIIAPLINKTHSFNSDSEYMSFACQQTYYFNEKEYHFSKGCIKNWYLSYKKYGLEALSKKERKDKANSRKMNNETMNRIQELRQTFPKITGTAIYHILLEEGYITASKVSLCTILRYLRSNNLKASQTSTVERRMFEMEHVNDCCYTNFFKIPTFMIKALFYKDLLSN